jgi:glycosidase
MTVGEMPGVTPEQGRLYTDPARDELNMISQFAHMVVDVGADGAPAGGAGGHGLEQPATVLHGMRGTPFV